MIHGFQIALLLPLRALPFKWSSQLYEKGVCYTKGAFGCLLMLMCQWFAPTKLCITFQQEGNGRFSKADIENMAVRDQYGRVISLNLPTKFVLTSNHQVYADWWYTWCLTYFIGSRGVHGYIYITLKKSLQYIPVVGWGMQLFKFIFLSRSWASDRVLLASNLAALGRRAEEEDNPLCFILYPEGTLVSQHTRPISKKFADKVGISDMKNMLLPRSTGLHYSLRSLAPRIPGLQLMDLTMVYPGIPPMGYGQSYYTLRSIFMGGVPPPAVHIHLRIFDVASDVPIGAMPTRKSAVNGLLNQHPAEVEIPEAEKEQFDVWLRELWQEKDESVTRFLETASFSEGRRPTTVIEIPLRLRRKRDILDAFCFFLPACAFYIWVKI